MIGGRSVAVVFDIFNLTVKRPSVLRLDAVDDGVIDSNGNGALDSWLKQSDAGNNAYKTNVTRQQLITDGAMNGYRAIYLQYNQSLCRDEVISTKEVSLSDYLKLKPLNTVI